MNYIAPTLADAYIDLLEDLVSSSPMPGYKSTDAEVLGATVVLTEPRYNLIQSYGRKFNYRYMVAEMMWNAQPTDKIAPLKWVMPSVENYVQDQPEGTHEWATWAYGESVFPGLVSCYELLKEDLDTRRAVIRVAEPYSHYGTPPCLVSIQFIHRDGKLHAFTQMRSNDAWRGFPLDVYQFSMWQIFLAAALGVEVGHYNHSIGSLHLYTRDREEAEKYISAEFNSVRSSTPDKSAFNDIVECRWGLAMSTHSTTLVEGSLPWVGTYLNLNEQMCPEFLSLKSAGCGRW